MSSRRRRALCGLIALASVSLVAASQPATLLDDGFYPRAVMLAHAASLNGTVLATVNDGREGRVHMSTDGARTFSQLSTIDPGPDAVGLCCIELFEFPIGLGTFPAGTLLWAGSVTTDISPVRQMELRIWRSSDQGVTWTPHGACARGSGGLWEPHFLVAADGSLVCQFADETHAPAHSQILSQVISNDGGLTWSAPRAIVQLDQPFLRPGMPTTTRRADGTWLLSYEICAWVPNCEVWIRSSDDGLSWGDPRDPGDPIVVDGGLHLTHTPVISWSPYGGPEGTLVLSGQILLDGDGAPAPGNGQTLLYNREGGRGAWSTMPAPVTIADPFDHFCPNYSSPVLALGGAAILELASDWDGRQCDTYYGTGTLPAPTTTGSAPATTTSTDTPSAKPGVAGPSVAGPSVARPAFTG